MLQQKSKLHRRDGLYCQQEKPSRKGVKYAKKNLCFSIVLILVFCSCQSDPRTEIDRTAIEHTVAINRITEAVSDYGKHVDDFVSEIENQSRNIGAGLDALTILLEQYFTGVRELLHRYKSLQRFIESKGFYYQETYENYNSVDSIDYNQDNH